MTFQQLTFVTEVARCSSINKAAERLYTHQSNVSNVVKQLEDELGIQIFSRTQKGVQLTNEGREFLIYAEDLVEKKASVENIYSVRSRNKPLYFTVSSMRSFFAYAPFISWTPSLDTMNSPLNLRLKKCSFRDVLDDVSDGNADIGIVFTLNSQKRKLPQSAKIKSLNYFELGESHINIVLRENHPILKERNLQNIVNYPYVIIEENENFGTMYEEESTTIAQLFSKTPKHIISTNDSMTCQNIVAETDAFFISTTPWKHSKYYDFTSVPLVGNENTLMFYYVTRKDQEVSPLMKAYIDSLKGVFAAL